MDSEEMFHDPLKFQKHFFFEHKAVQSLQRDAQDVLQRVEHRRVQMGAAVGTAVCAAAVSGAAGRGISAAWCISAFVNGIAARLLSAALRAGMAEHAARLEGQGVKPFCLSAGNAGKDLHADAVILENLQLVDAADEGQGDLLFLHGDEGHKQEIEDISLVQPFHRKIFRQLRKVGAVIDVFQVLFQMGKVIAAFGGV